MTQSASLTHPLLHAVAPQTYGVQETVWAVGQLPAPSQPAASTAMPPAHEAERQLVDDDGNVHCVALVPSQVPAHGAVPPHAGRLPTGAPITVVQLPALTLHAWH